MAAALGSLLVFVPQTRAHSQPPAAVRLSGCADMEAFLKTARIVRRREIPVGVTLPQRATLDDGRVRHDAAIQDVDIQATQYSTSAGTELNFRDTWKFNVAGYELAKTIELNMVPPYVERSVGGTDASLSWWVADTMMERDRIRKRIVAPDAAAWNGQMYAVRLFHELIGDSDFNATNILITQNWRVWMIDFTRAFRRTTALRSPERLKNVDRRLLTNLQALTRETLRQRLGRWLLHPEIDAVEARRDAIVAVLERERAARGDAAVFYELPQVGEPCGAGLDSRRSGQAAGAPARWINPSASIARQHFRGPNRGPWGVTRRFKGFSAAAEENGLSRLYAGFHFRHAVKHGRRQG